MINDVSKAQVDGKVVVVRCDFDVPVSGGMVKDKSRIERTIPTLRLLRERNAKLFLIGHLGRPSEKDINFSLRIVQPILEDLLNEKIEFSDKIPEKVNSEIVLLENLRFWPEEEENDIGFAEKIAAVGQVYVNECFSVSHRAHASVAALAGKLPAYFGLELKSEVENLSKVFVSQEKPLVAIIGGAKLETKLPAIKNLAKSADKVLVGGKLMFEAKNQELPANVLLAVDDLDEKDIGPKSLELFKNEINKARMIVWNGPMGMFEDSNYQTGTREVAKMVGQSAAYSIVGGGDTIAALNQENLLSKIDFVSSGGGAMLEFLEGKRLPGLEVLGYY